jgi:hypothetical protein
MNPNRFRIYMQGLTTWSGTPNRLCWFLQPEIDGALFGWRVKEFAFGWSGTRKPSPDWERVLTTEQVRAEFFTRLHTFVQKAEEQAWI